jgi:prepilin-type processing-associated H-X9-DG protein
MILRAALPRRAFTRADLAVLAAAVVLSAGMLLPAALAAQRRSGRDRSANHLKEIGRGMQQHVGAFGFFPGNGGPPMEAVTTPDARTGFPDSEKFRWGYGDPKRAGRLQTGSWAYAILPYVGEEKAFRAQDHTRAVPIYYTPLRREARAYHVPKNDPIYAKWSYQDAGLGPWGRTDYAANDQVVLGGMGNVMKPGQVRDGLETTALAAEKAMDTRAVRAGGWYWDEPIILGGSGGTGRKGSRLLRDSCRMLEEAADNWGSPDAAGVHFLFCDGHVRLLGYATARTVVAAVISPRGGEDVDLDGR